MNIIFDERETALYEISTTRSIPKFQDLNISKRVLSLGDILITNMNNEELVLIERKSVSDLLASIKDGRYEEQSHRLIHASGIPKHNIIYVIEGGFSFLKAEDKRTVYSALTSLNLFKGFSIYHTISIEETSEWILYITDKIGRGLKMGKQFCSSTIHQDLVVTPESYSSMVHKVKQQNITSENIGEIMLCQIPGISTISAKAILNKFDGSFLKLITAIQDSESEIIFKEIVLEKDGKTRKISKACYENIVKYLREYSKKKIE